MNCLHGSLLRGARPGTARVLVTELSGSGHINPTPTPKPREELEILAETYLTPEKLRFLCGSQELSAVTSLDICINTQESTLGNFGAYLPKLVQLKMNNSVIKSVRDLGTTLSHLQVLWMPCCCLQDLDGILSLPSLKELYLAYNRVSDLSQIGMLENLQVLDLEGNDVDDLVQVQYLGLCGKLHDLTLDGNPLCRSPNPNAPQTADYSYRAAVRELVPQLRYLDNVSVEEEDLSCSNTLGEDWETLRNSIKEHNSSQLASDLEESVDRASPLSRPSTAGRPATSLSCVRPLSSQSPRPHTGYRPMTAAGLFSPPGSRPGSADSDLSAVEAETSALTHGAGQILFCGNPAQAIRARREKLRTAPTTSTLTPREMPIHVPEHTYDLEEPDARARCDVFAELQAWRTEHSSRLEAIKTEKLPQVLAIRHSDEEYDADEDRFDVLRDASSDEDDKEEKCCENMQLPDSLFQSPSPDTEEKSPDVTQLSLSLDTALLPSPPPSAAAVNADWKAPGIRTRRLRLMQANTELFPVFNSVKRHLGAATTRTDKKNFPSEEIQRVTGTNVKLSLLPDRIPHPPPSTGKCDEMMHSCVEKDLSCKTPGSKKPLPKVPDQPATITRPHTARAALQKHYQQSLPQPSRGSAQPD